MLRLSNKRFFFFLLLPGSLGCSLDRPESCGDGTPKHCVSYKPSVLKKSRTILTSPADGRTGNKITAYANLLFLKWLYDDEYLLLVEKDTRDWLRNIFDLGVEFSVREEVLCDWKRWPFKDSEADFVNDLGEPEYKRGKALQLTMDVFKAGSIVGWWKMYMTRRKDLMENIKFKPEIVEATQKILKKIASKMGKKPKNVTFVGIHSRRTDYLAYRQSNMEDAEELEADYYQDAMEHFRDEFGEENTAFIFVSDDMEWAKNDENLMAEKNLFFEGCGNGADWRCVGQDLALLAACNHTIQSRGSFSQWAAYLSGGDSYTEYGPMMAHAITGEDR